MLPAKLSTDYLALKPGEDRYTISVVFKVSPNGQIIDDETWIGKSIIKSIGLLEWDDVDNIVYKRQASLAASAVDNVEKLGVSCLISLTT